MSSKTLYDKLWESHVVHEEADGTCQIGRASCRERVSSLV